jgi:hypothetical protein
MECAMIGSLARVQALNTTFTIFDSARTRGDWVVRACLRGMAAVEKEDDRRKRTMLKKVD